MKDDLISRVQSDVLHEQMHRDGIPQIAVGVFLMIAALFMMEDKGSLVGIYVVFIPLIIKRLRNRYTYPRVGYAKLKEKESRRMSVRWLILGIIVLGATLFFVFNRNSISSVMARQVFSWFMVGIAVMVVLMLVYRYIKEKNSVFLFYGAFIIFLGAAILYFHLSKVLVHYVVLGFGAFNLIYGIIMLTLFVKRYPVLENEDK